MAAIPIDKTQWSRSSQRALAAIFNSSATTYEDINFNCQKCLLKSTFPAAEQKIHYEVRKKYVAYMPTRCTLCEEKLKALLESEKVFQRSWNTRRETLKSDVVFLKNWLSLLKEIHTYGRYTNSTMVTGILKLLRAT